MKRLFSAQRTAWPKPLAFTLTECVVLLFMIGGLVSLTLVTMAASRPNTAAIQCLNNHRQLTEAWRMYAEENAENLAFNRDGGNVGKSSADAAWVGGWLDYSSSTDNTNVSLLIDHVRWPCAAYLGPYVQSPSVFKCPADNSVVSIVGVQMPRVRSVSMSCFIGQKARAWTSPSKYLSYTKMSQIQAPSQIFVLLDEQPAGINDGCFFSNPDARWNIIDYPASYHGGAGSFSFVDGHAELHKWKDPRTMPALVPGQVLVLNTFLTGDVDVDWLQEHTSQLR